MLISVEECLKLVKRVLFANFLCADIDRMWQGGFKLVAGEHLR